jgi:hypothetical protein
MRRELHIFQRLWCGTAALTPRSVPEWVADTFLRCGRM